MDFKMTVKRDTQAVHAVERVLRQLEPELLFSVIDTTRPRPIIEVPTMHATDQYGIHSGKWMVKDTALAHGLPADLRLHHSVSPILPALSIIGSSILHELDTASRFGDTITAHVQPELMALLKRRASLIFEHAYGERSADPAVTAHARLVYNYVQPFIASAEAANNGPADASLASSA